MGDDVAGQSTDTRPGGESNGSSVPARRENGKRSWLKGLFPGRGNGSALRETFEELIEQHEEREAPIDPGERALLEKILMVGGVTVEDVMVPRVDVVAVEASTEIADILNQMTESGHSRLPVYRESLDDAIGMVLIKDLLPAVLRDEPFVLREIVRDILFVAPTMRVLDLLLQMRQSRTHMALVVDEYGGIDGLVTIEDLVEQIVGDIEDEHDVDEDVAITRRQDGTFVVDARTTVEDFEDRIGLFVTEEERANIDTLGGLVFSLTGRVPIRGELVRHEESGIEFEVIEADPRRIRRLRVCNVPVDAPSASGIEGAAGPSI